MKKIIFIVFLLSLTLTIHKYNQPKNLQKGISEKILRLHVIANSDSDEDQNAKLAVKDAIVTYLKDILKDSSSLEESKHIVSEHFSDINQIAVDTLKEKGMTYNVDSKIEYTSFPAKSYGDVILPPGDYTALRVTLGNAEGKNWWCILYPPLCFVDATCGVVPEESKNQLKHTLTEDEYNSILNENTDIEYRFKIVEIIENWGF